MNLTGFLVLDVNKINTAEAFNIENQITIIAGVSIQV